MKPVNESTYSQPKPILNETNTRGITMNNNNATISCPHCDSHIDMTDLMRGQISKQLETEHQAELQVLKTNFDQQLEEQTNKQRGLTKDYAAQKAQEATERAQTEMSELIAALNTQLEESNSKVQKLHAATANVEQMKREHSAERAKYEADSEVKFSSKLLEDSEKQRQTLESQNETRLQQKMVEQELEATQLRKQLQDQENLTAAMTRKLEQGSQQLQGEIQELAIEQWLHREYPQDDIKEIKKGRHGADTLQIVNSPENIECGSILFESKNTKGWKNDFIPKFRADMIESKSDIGVIVTRTMPSDMDRFGYRDGIWICSFEDYKILAAAHREAIIGHKKLALTIKNRGTMKERLYDFVTSTQYQSRIEVLVKTFIEMQEMLNKEKRQQTTSWKIREKHLENIISSTTAMYGSIKGIAGNSVKQISELEVPTDEELELLENKSSSHLISSTIN